MKSVKVVVQNELCCGCGTCGAICPTKAISIQISVTGKLEPDINDKCISCGKCLKYCPQVVFNYEFEQMKEFGKASDRPLIGTYKELLNVHVKDKDVLQNSTSGAMVVTLVKKLLQDNVYESAFLIDTYNYSDIVYTVRYTREMDFSTVPKSRYVQVSHERSIRYMINYPEEKIIFVGTSCFIHSVLNVIKQNNLDRNNYLLIGLFCDKTMTYHVWDYFNNIFANGLLKGLLFRDKKTSGWPGDVKLINAMGEEFDISRKERIAVKDYFMPEACLYCMDKLNRFADFSVGDNYTTIACHENGSNTLFIRTERAYAVWEQYKSHFIATEIDEEAVAKSQKIEERRSNLAYIELDKKDTLGFEIDVRRGTSNWEIEHMKLKGKISQGKIGDYKSIYAQILQARAKRKKVNGLKQVPKKLLYSLAKVTGLLAIYKKIKE